MTLREAALAVRARAYAPYSGFKVGAAIRAQNGAIFTGCNVENAAYPQGMCAEAAALAAMVSAGQTRLTEVYVVADAPVPVSPCGGCRQKLVEFGAGDVIVTMEGLSGAGLSGKTMSATLASLLPGAFGAAHMRSVSGEPKPQ